ncbi:chemotaxis-specific protein-glutamate methyltransferase CheB [Carboxydochorda subterranea]|uniref:Protein-glutamate methylesterase/protein-glutamine glutaminase n=1 Tax=Carboxydichorda subterranea TaxID=3109565 RepID=A0ABZ1C0Q0_9FIRM|nr:chemotaxis-specific protein-glutamate methyltransferase CheB [Limnochorda sp. L945t]WRP17893.1 chemotaxis-specific protein-glutamate methyltransferase CheB [Limnochorda sp. L945t]
MADQAGRRGRAGLRSPGGRQVRVAVVDDSPFMRAYLARLLEQSGRFEVVAAVGTGEALLDLLGSGLSVDVVTLDVEMPGMGGLECLRRVMRLHPTPVVMLSAHTTRSSAVTLEALSAGAVDFVPKPERPVTAGSTFLEDLVVRLEQAARAPARTLQELAARTLPAGKAAGQREERSPQARRPAQRVIAIGASTGGPRTLEIVMAGLDPGLPAAVLITQHMPPGFTASLARRLDGLGLLPVHEAWEGAPLQEGVAYVAPGGLHLTVDEDRHVHLDDGPPVHHVRPAVDVMLESVAARFGEESLAVILTGMGSDGARGARAIKAAGGACIVQEEGSCVVAGMPGSVLRAGLADGAYPPERIAKEMLRWALQRERREC